MPPKEKEDMILLDRQTSSMSTVTLSTDLSSSQQPSTLHPKKSSFHPTAPAPLNWLSIQQFLVSLIIYVVGIYYKDVFVANHEEAFTRTHPYQELTTGDLLLNFELNHPLVYPASVPSKLLHRTCIFLPLVVMVLIHLWTKSSWNCTLASASGLLSGIGICEVVTHVLKYYVLRRRPNFYSLCGWDPVTKTCTATAKKVLEAQLSFPSGHSSIGWCGTTYLVLMMVGRLRLSQQSATIGSYQWWRPWTMWVMCLVPWGWAAYVASSRIHDKWAPCQ